MKDATIEIVTISGTKYYLGKEHLESMGVPDHPKSIISNFIRGSKGPLMTVYDSESLDGDKKFLNANFIETVHIKYD